MRVAYRCKLRDLSGEPVSGFAGETILKFYKLLFVCMRMLLVLRLHLTLGSRMTESIVVAWVRIRCANAMDAVNQVPSLFV